MASLFPFGMLYLRSYLFVVIARNRPQPYPLLSDNYSALAGMPRHRSRRPARPGVGGTALTLMWPDSFVLTATTSPHARRSARALRRTMYMSYCLHIPRARAQSRHCMAQRQAPYLNTHWI